MSAGEFTTALYRADSLEIHPIRIQVETAQLNFGESTNASVAGPETRDEWVKSSQGANSFGLRPRKVRIRFDAGSEPAGYLGGQFHEIVVFDPLLWTTIKQNDTCTYLGAPARVRGKIAEKRFPTI